LTETGMHSVDTNAARPQTVQRSAGPGTVKQVYISLGSNLGDRLENIRRALDLLNQAGIRVRRVSSFYKTEPVDFRPQPWFVNCVAEIETDLMPLRLLKTLQSIERDLGRRHGIAKGPRPIDIDILLYGNVVIRSALLMVPHERMTERRFVLIPLRELAPQLRHPATQRTVLEILNEAPDTGQVLKLKPQM
jgi:2-amino-4-hydroxy-6-hydroxymethyldihydropteridine diphosphokinase